MADVNSQQGGSGKYAQVTQQEDLEAHLANPASGPSRTSTFTHIPETRGLSWQDSFYDGKHGIVAAFDRDTERAGNYFMWSFFGFASFFVILGMMNGLLAYEDGQSDNIYIEEQQPLDEFMSFYMLFFALVFVGLAFRARQTMRVQHVAVSTEGIRIDNGSFVNMTIPFEHIHKCEAVDHKYCCSMISADFQVIRVTRTAAPMEQIFFRKTKKVELFGIIHSQEFADLVMAMKDAEDNGTYEGARVELQNVK